MEKNSISMLIASMERDFNYIKNRNVREYNLGKHDIRVLKIIYANEGLSQNDACNILREDKITITKAVKSLVSKEYVEKIKDSKDKRITRLYVTEKGIEVRKELLSMLFKLDDIIVEGFSIEDREKAFELICRMAENINKEVLEIKENK